MIVSAIPGSDETKTSTLSHLTDVDNSGMILQPPVSPPVMMNHASMAAAAAQAEAHNQRYQADQQTQVGWMTEAKDWAGELISGQSATGRILVSRAQYVLRNFSYLFY